MNMIRKIIDTSCWDANAHAHAHAHEPQNIFNSRFAGENSTFGILFINISVFFGISRQSKNLIEVAKEKGNGCTKAKPKINGHFYSLFCQMPCSHASLKAMVKGLLPLIWLVRSSKHWACFVHWNSSTCFDTVFFLWLIFFFWL